MTGADLDELRRIFCADQAAAALEDACEVIAATAGARGVDYSQRPSGWVLHLMRRARRMRCGHGPREGAGAVVFVPAHVGQLLCRACAHQVAKDLRRSLDGRRCDVCREEAALEPFMFQLDALLVTGRCCAGCRPTVYGEAR
ncbi:hypothetical protein [Blastococcus sp. TF02A-35]|uniref:hypothetical protein n=1 Tax=Blastococcus sp. TF02A-35 TaxID=2559612 RepID=UPI0010737728|nr:hypothetical protein [Blastococcus sp. TF02A_35]TFV49534.1 hypothetical protein E4P43_11845 [Blastococcus sp. TF02A_35]